MQTQRATRIPGPGTLWSRTLERLLQRMPERAPAADRAAPGRSPATPAWMAPWQAALPGAGGEECRLRLASAR